MHIVYVNIFQRFSRSDKRSKLPKWIQEHLKDSLCNLSTEEAVQVSRLVAGVCVYDVYTFSVCVCAAYFDYG